MVGSNSWENDLPRLPKHVVFAVMVYCTRCTRWKMFDAPNQLDACKCRDFGTAMIRFGDDGVRVGNGAGAPLPNVGPLGSGVFRLA
jgi:hypothetical protein